MSKANKHNLVKNLLPCRLLRLNKKVETKSLGFHIFGNVGAVVQFTC